MTALEEGSKKKYRLLVRRASQLVQVASSKSRLLKAGGDAMDSISVIEKGSMAVGHDGKIVAVGADDSERIRSFDEAEFESVIDLAGQVAVVPGLCDAHTHALFSGSRVAEFDLKVRGATYLAIHEAGGGIASTVRAVRESPPSSLLALLLCRLRRMTSFGTTTVECKSGYGLSLESELKMLRVIGEAAKTVSDEMTIVANYCGAHSWMKDEWDTADAYADDIVGRHIPAVVREGLAHQIDVFHEEGVFNYGKFKLKKGYMIVVCFS